MIRVMARSPNARQPYNAMLVTVSFISAEDPEVLNPSITGSSMPKTMAQMKVSTPYFNTVSGLDIFIQFKDIKVIVIKYMYESG